MSRIEEALKKARESRKNLVVTADDHQTTETNSNQLTTRSMSVVRNATTSLIKSMKYDVTVEEDDLINKGIIRPNSEKSDVTDSFRYLRTQLLKKSKNNNFIVLVTSCLQGGDSSFVAMNMGAAFSFDEAKTSLVIDCDFQTTYLEDMIDLESESGLVDFLDGNAEVSDIIRDVGIKRLRIIPSGKQQNYSSESFTSERMKLLLDGLVERYQDRYVVLNSPAVIDSVDTSMLVDLVDYVVVVVPYGKVKSTELETALKRIDKDKLIGTVINDVPSWV